MTKLTLLIVVVCSVTIGYFNAESAEENLLERDPNPYDVLEDDNEMDRAGDKAGTSAAAMARPKPMLDQGRPGQRLTTLKPAPNRVECYVCTDCPRVHLNTTTKLCPYSYDGTMSRQSCVVYVEQYRHMRRPWVIRGCTSERGTCLDIKKSHSLHEDIVKLQYCNECEGDRCNTSSGFRALSDVTMAFVALVVTPLVAKYTLS